MTTAQNNAYADQEVVQAPKSSSQAINSGDLVMVSSNLVVPATSGLSCFGVSEDTSPVASLGDLLTTIVVRRRGLFKFVVKSGDTVAFDTPVYVGADAQTVTITDPGSGKIIARCRELASVTGDGVARYLFEFKPDAA